MKSSLINSLKLSFAQAIKPLLKKEKEIKVAANSNFWLEKQMKVRKYPFKGACKLSCFPSRGVDVIM